MSVPVPLFSTPDVACEWEPRKRFLDLSNGARIVVGGAWSPGMPPVEPGAIAPRGWYVARTKRERLLGVRLVGDNNLSDGAYQGGTDIVLDPFGQPYSRAVRDMADRTMQRHNTPALDWFTGTPLHPDVFGDVEYALDQDVAGDTNTERVTQLRPFARPLPASHPQAWWKKIAASHLVRAYWRDVAAWHRESDPVARIRILVQAFDVMYSYRHRPIGDPSQGFKLSLGQMLLNVTANPNAGQMGIIRWFAHAIRAVAEALDALGEGHDEMRELLASWLRMAILTVHRGQCLNGAWGDNHFGQQHEQEQPWLVPQPGYELLPLSSGEMPAFQGPYMFCAIDRAAEVLDEPLYTQLAEQCLTRYLSIYRTCRREPGKYNAVPGLPYWIETSRNGAALVACVRGIGKADTTWQPDVDRVAAKRSLEVPQYGAAA